MADRKMKEQTIEAFKQSRKEEKKDAVEGEDDTMQVDLSVDEQEANQLIEVTKTVAQIRLAVHEVLRVQGGKTSEGTPPRGELERVVQKLLDEIQKMQGARR